LMKDEINTYYAQQLIDQLDMINENLSKIDATLDSLMNHMDCNSEELVKILERLRHTQ